MTDIVCFPFLYGVPVSNLERPNEKINSVSTTLPWGKARFIRSGDWEPGDQNNGGGTNCESPEPSSLSLSC
jgi:hypothetical protein